MKARLWIPLLGVMLWTAPAILAQDACFYRVAGPTPSRITELRSDGWVTWTNSPTNAVFRIQLRVTLESQDEWKDYLQVPATTSSTTWRILDFQPPPGMAFIPAGLFQMGDSFAELDFNTPRPVHDVFVSGCYMDRFEVTKAMWDEVVTWATNHGYKFTFPGAGKAPAHPVSWVGWHDVLKWCNARSEREGLTPCYYTNSAHSGIFRSGYPVVVNSWVDWNAEGYRLPTEAEWEKAARGGLMGKRFPMGDTISHEQANYQSNTNWSFDLSSIHGAHPAYATNGTPRTSPVGSFAPNGYGLHDMAGNVAEACWDGYASYTTNAQIDPHGPDNRNLGFGSTIVIRGGSWTNRVDKPLCAVAARMLGWIQEPQSGSYDDVGFRCVRRTSP